MAQLVSNLPPANSILFSVSPDVRVEKQICFWYYFLLRGNHLLHHEIIYRFKIYEASTERAFDIENNKVIKTLIFALEN